MICPVIRPCSVPSRWSSISCTTRCARHGCAAADALGARTVDGLGMLIHQAALQQERWIGFRPDTAVMRTAAEAALADR